MESVDDRVSVLMLTYFGSKIVCPKIIFNPKYSVKTHRLFRKLRNNSIKTTATTLGQVNFSLANICILSYF